MTNKRMAVQSPNCENIAPIKHHLDPEDLHISKLQATMSTCPSPSTRLSQFNT